MTWQITPPWTDLQASVHTGYPGETGANEVVGGAYRRKELRQNADGTYLAFGPDVNLPRLLSWLRPDQQSMFGVA